LTVIAISAARLNLLEAAAALRTAGVKVDVFHVLWLKPFSPSDELLASLRRTGRGLVIDSDFEVTGASQSLAYDLMHRTGARVHALGLEDRVCGVAARVENITPSAEKIRARVEELIQG
jgi:pyruvate/2-oxoglutarate/acetoin dehydrogenase E1 component